MKKRYQPILLGLLWMLFSQVALAQFTVTGTVTDANTNEPLIGVNIFHQPTATGTTTDENGQFSITLPGQSATLRISYVGYSTQNVEVSPSNNKISIALKPDVANLEELVVTGLASTLKRKNLANAVTRVTGAQLTGQADPQTVDRALQGKIPGVRIQQTNAAPGGGFNMQLRGISTLGAGQSQPLIIVDGVYISNDRFTTGRSTVSGAGDEVQDGVANRLADLNPEDIASIEVLKGPSAAAIYGQRANAGVIIITTKTGRSGTTQVSFRQQVGFNDVINLLGRTEWTEERIRAFWGDGERGDLEIQRLQQARQNGTIRNLEEEFYGNNGLIRNTNLSVSGGNDKTRFFVSGALNREDGIIENTGFDRNSLRANLDHDINENIRISSLSNFLNTESNRGFTGNQNNTGGSLVYNLAFHPNYAYGLLQQNPDGTFPDSDYFAENPFRLIEVAKNDQEVNRLIQSVVVDADLASFGASQLGLTVQGGFDLLEVNSTVYFPEFMQFQTTQPFPGDVIQTTQESFNTNLQASLVFNTQVESGMGDLFLTTQVNASRFSTETQLDRIRGQGLLPGQTNTDNAAQVNPDQNFTDVTDLGFAAQQEFNLDDKIIATIGGRLDKSTLNADAGEFFFYPKASLAVNIANFDFWSFEPVTQLKLRSAYGETGGLPNFAAIFNSLGTTNIGEKVGTLAANNSFDPDLKPERAKEIELGLDVALFDGRVSFEGTYYNKTVEDLILPLTPSPATGVNQIITNAAELKNTGFELGLAFTPVRQPNFSWTSRILWWTNDSEITDLAIPPTTNQALGFIGFGATRIEEGVSPTALFGIPFTEDSQYGGLTKYGDFQADFQMSFSGDFTIYKNFEVGMLWQWSKGGENLDLYKLLLDSGGNSPNFFVEGSAEIRETLPPFGTTEYYVQDASYVKLREASVTYTVPNTFLSNLFGNTVKQVQLGVSGNNLLMFTDFRGYDPEVNFAGTNVLIPSVSIAPFPSARKVLFTVNIDF